MTMFGDQLYHLGGVPVGGSFTTGDVYFVRPSGGNSANRGTQPGDAITTVSAAHTLMTADNQDIAYLIAESNSASSTTDYQSATLTWSKDCTRLIGINSNGLLGSRSRIAQLSTATGIAPLMTWSADSSLMAGIHVFHGVDDSTSIGGLNVTGSRNYFYRNHIASMGNTTMAQSVASVYSLRVSGDENLFEECVIGVDTIEQGTGQQLLLAGGGTRNTFRKCIFQTSMGAGLSDHFFVTVDADGIDRWTLFEDCTFINNTQQGIFTTMTEGMSVAAGTSPTGQVILKNCTFVGCTDIVATNTGGTRVYIDGAAPTNTTSGLAINPAVD